MIWTLKSRIEKKDYSTFFSVKNKYTKIDLFDKKTIFTINIKTKTKGCKMRAKTCKPIITALVIVIILLLVQIYEGNKKLNSANAQLDIIFNDKYSLSRSTNNKYYYCFKKDCNITFNPIEESNYLENIMNFIESMNIKSPDFNLSN